MAQFDVDAINVESLRQRTSVKWRTFDPDVLPAWVAEMDFPLAAEVAAALHAAIDRSDTGYRSLDGLAESLVRFADDSWSWRSRATTCFLRPRRPQRDRALALGPDAAGRGRSINPPVYHPFFPVVREVVGRGLVEVPMARADDGSYGWDLPALEQAFAPTRGHGLPHVESPQSDRLGTQPGDVEAISLMASTHGVSVVADEIHASLVLPGAVHVPYLSVATPEASAVSVLSASKAWNLPGLKCAQAVASPAIATRITATLPMSVSFGIGHLGVLATMAAYRDGAPWLGEVIAILDGNRRLLGDLLAEHLPRVRYTAPAATYLAWLDLRDYGLGDDLEALLARGPGGAERRPEFRHAGPWPARLNFATSPAILREIVERMATVVQ